MLPHSPASEHCTKTLQNFVLCECDGGEERGRGGRRKIYGTALALLQIMGDGNVTGAEN